MPGEHDIIVLGASMGGVEALARLVSALPADLPASLFVVTHVPGGFPSSLADILNRAGRLPAASARHGEVVHKGRIYVAVPDRHLLLAPGTVKVESGPRENGFRPAIDPLFRSAARAYGPRVIAVVLTGGGMSDGVAGLLAVRAGGGTAVIQDPDDAVMPVLPRSALALAGADHVVPIAKIPPLLVQLVAAPPKEGAKTMKDSVEQINQRMKQDSQAQASDQRAGQLAFFTCPECGGALWQVEQEKVLQFSCHVGHMYYGEQLLAEKDGHLEAALWTAVRIFKERATLSRQLAHREGERDAGAAERFDEQAKIAEDYCRLIQDHILAVFPGPPEAPGGTP